MKKDKVSSAVIRRLPRYYRHLNDLYLAGVERISSNALGKSMGLTASQVRTVEGRALRKLRSDARLNRWHDAVIAGESWRGTGLSAWQNGGSVEERAIEWVEKLESSR